MPKENQKLEVKISEEELRELIHGEDFRWVIKTNKGEDINVLVRLERFDDLEIEEKDEEQGEIQEEDESEDNDIDEDDDF